VPIEHNESIRSSLSRNKMFAFSISPSILMPIEEAPGDNRTNILMPRTLYPEQSEVETLPVPTKRLHGNSLYRPEYDEIAFAHMMANGGHISGLKSVIPEIGESTLREWARKNESFAIAIKSGRDEYQVGVGENVLFDLANGYEYDELSEEFIEIDGERYIERMESKQVGENAKGAPIFKSEKVLVLGIKRKIAHKRVQPNLGALIFLLCNRKAKRWKNTQHQIIDGNIKHLHKDDNEPDWSKLPRELLEQLREHLENARAIPVSAADVR